MCAFPAYILANPYSLYGQGNCAYFAHEMMNKYWPVNFDIPRNYDACEWVKLAGQEQRSWDGTKYRLCATDRPVAGDLIVWPATGDNRRGHVAFITEVLYVCDIDFDTWEADFYTEYEVLESANYADEFYFSYILNQCRYRPYWYSDTEVEGCTFLTCKEVTQ